MKFQEYLAEQEHQLNEYLATPIAKVEMCLRSDNIKYKKEKTDTHYDLAFDDGHILRVNNSGSIQLLDKDEKELAKEDITKFSNIPSAVANILKKC